MVLTTFRLSGAGWAAGSPSPALDRLRVAVEGYLGCSRHLPCTEREVEIMPRIEPDPDRYPPLDPGAPIPDDPGELEPDTPDPLPPAPVEPVPDTEPEPAEPPPPGGVPEPA
jgi:hypothetical protein